MSAFFILRFLLNLMIIVIIIIFLCIWRHSLVKLEEIIEEIKLELTGGVLELEISDDTIGKLVNKALREIQRYIDETKLVTVPFSKCIDLTGFKSSSITQVYRAEAIGDSGTGANSGVDPMWAQQWTVFSNGNGSAMYNLNNYLLNYMSYSTILQVRNTLSTDLYFKEDKHDNKLYINVSGNTPATITIEYVPLFEKVEDIQSDYWIDKLVRLSLALTKINLGRLRTYSKQSNALWTLDGETILAEGTEEAREIREELKGNSNLFFPID